MFILYLYEIKVSALLYYPKLSAPSSALRWSLGSLTSIKSSISSQPSAFRWRYFFMPNVFCKKGMFSKRHLTSLVKMAVFTKFFFTFSALPAPSARLPCQQGGARKFPDTASAAHPAGAVPRRRCWPAVLFYQC